MKKIAPKIEDILENAPSECSVNMFNALKDRPEEIIKWCHDEIKAYKDLIKLIKKGKA